MIGDPTDVKLTNTPEEMPPERGIELIQVRRTWEIHYSKVTLEVMKHEYFDGNSI